MNGMSQLRPYAGRQRFVVISWALAVVLASFSTFCVPARGAETKDKTQLAERKEFIRKAMEEQQERRREQAAEMKRRGIHAYITVTTLIPFGDWDFYFVKGGNIWWRPNAGQKTKEVIVPVGFVSDLASVPWFFWSAYRPEGRYAYAAVVHDYLYWTQMRPRKEADEIFKIAMEDLKVDAPTVKTLYTAVRSPFGKAAWEKNMRLKEAGECRFLKRLPDDLAISWSEWTKKPDVFEEENCNRKKQ
jgi:Protein of unknown function (DUF1353)